MSKTMFTNVGTFDAGVIGAATPMGFSGAAVRMTDSSIATAGAFLVGELEKRSDVVSTPLTSVTYPRDVPMKSGGGWVELISAMNVDYGVVKGSGDGAVQAGGANEVPIIQANFGKDLFKTHVFSIYYRVGILDSLRGNVTGRNIDKALTDGIRLSYDKHLDLNVYLGMERYGTTGLLNNANVVASNVTNHGSGTAWAVKTADQILADINLAISATWKAAEFDLSALPNHVLIPHDQFTIIATAKVSNSGETTILDFLLENNITKKNGGSLVIAPSKFCKGAGAGNTDRMVVYVNNDRFIACEELVPLHRIATETNMQNLSYDSLYMANLSEVEFFYYQTIRYFDGI